MEIATRQVNGVEFWEAPGLGAPHGFSTRLGGVSEGIYRGLNLGLRRGDDDNGAVRENYRRFLAAIGAEGCGLVTTDQVHGVEIRPVTLRDAKDDLLDPVPYEADGLVTDTPGLALTVFTADCIPILLCDPVRGAVAALHAGWRGTAGAIARKGVEVMKARYGCKAEDIRGAIGPGIEGTCYEVGPEVAQAVRGAFGPGAEDLIRPGPEPEKYFVDLKGVNALALTQAGVPRDRIAVCRECTHCHPERYWSHRYLKGGARGSQAAMIYLPKEGKP